jgi:ribosomal protein L37AE/L43A
MRRKCPVCGRMVVKRATGKIYRHKRITSVLSKGMEATTNFCEGTGRKVGR